MSDRMPAEWEPHDAVWVTLPHNAETWPGVLDQAQAQFDAFLSALTQVTRVCTTQDIGAPTADSWVRDYGPLFVHRGGELVAHDFVFNGYGFKYDPPETDEAAGGAIARHVGAPIVAHDFVLEGGSIDVNGQGDLLTTESCLLNENRNPTLTREQIEAKLRESFGATRIVWLPGGITGDDTDGHVDDLARFIGPRVVAANRPPQGHADHAMLERNWQALAAAGYDLVPLPVPEPIWFDYPGDRFTEPRREMLPASYANFLISNGRVFVPTFGQPSDEVACRRLDDAMPDHAIVPIRSEVLVVGQGALHCLTMQQPAVPG